MQNKSNDIKEARFDTRLSFAQKEFFERAAVLGGYRSLTDFVISTLQEKSEAIIEENERILASERDCEIFFDAIMNPPEPNENLKATFELYKKQFL